MDKYIIDTNIILDYPSVVEDKENFIIITTDVLKELDQLKRHVNHETAAHARRGAVYISNNMDKIKFLESEIFEGNTVDERLVSVTKMLDGILITNDVYLKVYANIKKAKTKGYSQKDNYSGIEYWFPELDNLLYNKDLDNLYSDGIIPKGVELYENEYLVIKNAAAPYYDKQGNEQFKDLAIFKFSNNELQKVERTSIKNKWIDKITPRNTEQICLFEALNNDNIRIIYAGGSYGSGKSFICNNYAIQELEHEKIRKIVYVPNNSFTENTMDIGALPGELLSKIEGQIGPLIDLVGIDEVQSMIAKEQLEIVPMNSIRGRSFTNSIIIVNEAQNLTEDHIKLLIARCGEDSKIIFDGDYHQADSAIFRNRNGLKLLTKLRFSPIYSKIFSTVQMTTIERSQVASAADYLDKYQ